MPPRPVAPLLLIALLAALLVAGCGDGASKDEGGTSAPAPAETSGAPLGASARSCHSGASDAGDLRATGIPCDQARQVMYGWRREPSCPLPAGASRGSCLTRSYRCQSVRADRGVAVSCARAGQSIAFLARP